ncbi:ChbG/HpnK family deacetylase [Nonomuraea terrae]|uniref:ChbG/HpnK family deacetylase n=1 Tax=Nonomuraea terrae TaxID=2530383 RepID=UPI0037AC0C25
MTRRLVITADDLGREPGTTEVIAALLAEGHVTATTLICVSPIAEQAANQVGKLGVVPRLHVTLTSERGIPRWRPLNAATSLVDPDGTLTDDPFTLGARGELHDVLQEADAQLRWMRDRGLVPEAADSHAGTLYGLHGRSWLAGTLEWCARHDLAFRLPRDPVPYVGGPLPPPLAAAHERAVALADALGVPIPRTIATNRRTAQELAGTRNSETTTSAASLLSPKAPASCSCTRPAKTRSQDRTASYEPGRRACYATRLGTTPSKAKTSRSSQAGGPDASGPAASGRLRRRLFRQGSSRAPGGVISASRTIS